MLPFNRTASLNAVNSVGSPRPKNISLQKSFMANILEMSLMSGNWATANGTDFGETDNNGDLEADPFLEGEEDSPMRQGPTVLPFRNSRCISRNLSLVLKFMRILAFFPGVFEKKNRRKSRYWAWLKYFLLYNIAILAIVLNCFLFKVNCWLMKFYRDKFGLMHAGTVSSIISGIKPLINAVVISIFIINIRAHYRLITTLDTVDLCFRAAFHSSPNAKKYMWIFFGVSSLFFIAPLTVIIVEVISFETKLGSISDTLFLIVPVLSLWNIVPLLYYDMYNRIVRFYCRVLIKSLDKEHVKRHFSLKFYYEQFMRITYVQEAIGSLFNPYILFSLAWSMAILCLTIYFLTEPASSLVDPIDPKDIANTAFRNLLNKKVAFNMGWSAIQVVIAFLNITVICGAGMQTNETTRQIVNHVLRIVPDANADLDRFQISCFVHKMTTQFMWGMTVWRAFPLERSTFFTLVSVVVTYSFLLLKLKENPAISPIRLVYTNATMSN